MSTGDKFIAEMYLRQPGFTYSACGPCTENTEKLKKIHAHILTLVKKLM